MRPVAITVLATLAVSALFWAGAARVVAQVIDPPERYQHAPDGAVVVTYIPYADVDHECRARMHAWGKGQIEACTEGPVQIRPEPCKAPRGHGYDPVACHENGHTNGWAPDHPRL